MISVPFLENIVWDWDRLRTVNNWDDQIFNTTVTVKSNDPAVLNRIKQDEPGYSGNNFEVRINTDENGFYRVLNLPAGKYTVSVDTPDGGTFVFDDRESTVTAGQEDKNNDRGFYKERDAPAPSTPESSAPSEPTQLSTPKSEPSEPSTPFDTSESPNPSSPELSTPEASMNDPTTSTTEEVGAPICSNPSVSVTFPGDDLEGGEILLRRMRVMNQNLVHLVQA